MAKRRERRKTLCDLCVMTPHVNSTSVFLFYSLTAGFNQKKCRRIKIKGGDERYIGGDAGCTARVCLLMSGSLTVVFFPYTTEAGSGRTCQPTWLSLATERHFPSTKKTQVNTSSSNATCKQQKISVQTCVVCLRTPRRPTFQTYTFTLSTPELLHIHRVLCVFVAAVDEFSTSAFGP